MTVWDNLSTHRSAALYRWMHVGRTGQWASACPHYRCPARSDQRRHTVAPWVDLTGLLARARACRQSLAGLDQARASEHERRAQLIAEMRNAGCSWRVITNALGVSAAWASEILSTVPDPAELAELRQSLGLDQPASAAAAEVDQDQAPEVDKSGYSHFTK